MFTNLSDSCHIYDGKFVGSNEDSEDSEMQMFRKCSSNFIVAWHAQYSRGSDVNSFTAPEIEYIALSSTFHTAVVTGQIRDIDWITPRMAVRLVGSSSDDYGHCCPPVFDPYTLVALLGGIALAAYFLRLVIVTEPAFQVMMRFRRRSGSARNFGELE